MDEIRNTEELEKLEKVPARLTYTVYKNVESRWGVSIFQKEEDKKRISVVGNDLPTSKDLLVDLYGRWGKGKDGKPQFSMEYYEISRNAEKESVIAYLQSLNVGVGKVLAENIYRTFGKDTLEIIEKFPERLTEAHGIGKAKAEKIKNADRENGQLKYLHKLFSELNMQVSAGQLRSIIAVCENRTEEKIRENPYIITRARGVAFSKADELARAMGFTEDCPERLDAYAVSILYLAEKAGDVCIPLMDASDSLIGIMQKKLGITEAQCRETVKRLKDTERIQCSSLGGTWYVYLKRKYNEEISVAENLNRLLHAADEKAENVDRDIERYESENSIKLADKQKDAVKMVFQHHASIITGGPGTGKTTVIKAILDVYSRKCSDDPVLLAPTGKAARRMSEATGYPAQTIHSVVGYKGEDVEISEEEKHERLEGSLFVIDEVSMMDQFITYLLLGKIRTGSRVVFVGDPDQLPSVGAGNVLADMLQSGKIPMTKLDVIYRQTGESEIVINANKIKNGDTDLVYGKHFVFEECPTAEETFSRACKRYCQCVKKFGIDNVVLLNPQRNNTTVSVDRFNKELQKYFRQHYDLLNIPKPPQIELSMKIGSRHFYKGDKIMQLHNTEDAKNGDTGYIRNIYYGTVSEDQTDGQQEIICQVEFNDDGNILNYTEEMMKDCDLAYCSTVHKSQGMEYQIVIEVISEEHEAMLKKNLIYTGLTRAKLAFDAVGSLKALNKAITSKATQPRHSLLAARLAG